MAKWITTTGQTNSNNYLDLVDIETMNGIKIKVYPDKWVRFLYLVKGEITQALSDEQSRSAIKQLRSHLTTTSAGTILDEFLASHNVEIPKNERKRIKYDEL